MEATTSRRAPRLLDETELAAWRGLLRLHSALTKDLDAQLVAGHRMSLSTYEVLLFLNDAPDGRLRMSELADSVLLSRSGLTRLVDRLQREGLLERDTCTEDARGAFAVITEEGRAVFCAARATHLDGVRELFLRHFTIEELEQLGEMWDRVFDAR